MIKATCWFIRLVKPIQEMAALLQNGDGKTDEQLAEEFGKLIAERTAVPDMAL